MFDPSGKRVLVTGASSGLGAALARGLAERGAVVGICARRADRLAEVLAQVQAPSPGEPVVDRRPRGPRRHRRFAVAVVDELGGLDVLVNNAGIPKRRWAWEHRPDEIADVLRINLESPIRLTLALLDALGRPRRATSCSSDRSRPGCRRRTRRSTPRRRPAITAFAESAVGRSAASPGEPSGCTWSSPASSTPSCSGCPTTTRRSPTSSRCRPTPSSSRSSAPSDPGAIETFVPAWFADIPPIKVGDLDGFLHAAACEYTRERLDRRGPSVPEPEPEPRDRDAAHPLQPAHAPRRSRRRAGLLDGAGELPEGAVVVHVVLDEPDEGRAGGVGARRPRAAPGPRAGACRAPS